MMLYSGQVSSLMKLNRGIWAMHKLKPQILEVIRKRIEGKTT
jgi:hypothetical protein